MAKRQSNAQRNAQSRNEAGSESLDPAALDRVVDAMARQTPDALAKASEEGLPDLASVSAWSFRLRRLVLLTRDPAVLRSEVPALAEETRRLVECSDLPAGLDAARVSEAFLAALPEIRARLAEDVEAAFEGDPAAKSYAEIVAAYPAVRAIATYRLAHTLHGLGVPGIPRMMSEEAHAQSGIDIHPGARIGRRFFVDHGTGVVIGETCEIGDGVVLYQGVTLGALAPRKGQMLRGVKRHPTIEDDVTIYAAATILGGETVVGRGSVIGGNVWITQSIPPCSKVQVEAPQLLLQRDGECESQAEQLHWDI